GEREGDREAGQQHDDQAGEHDRRQVLCDQACHCPSRSLSSEGAPAAGSSSSRWPARIANRRMISATPCRASETKPSRITSLIGQMINPPGLSEISPDRTDERA